MKLLELIDKLKDISKNGENDNMPVIIDGKENGKFIKTVFIDSYIDYEGEEIDCVKIIKY